MQHAVPPTLHLHMWQVAQQIRAAQQKAALAGQAPPAWAIGALCHAMSALDGDWREALVKGISAAGNFVVTFTGRDDLEEVRPHHLMPARRLRHACFAVRSADGSSGAQVERDNVKAPPAVEEVYRGVAAPSRLKVDETATVTEMPKVGGLFPLCRMITLILRNARKNVELCSGWRSSPQTTKRRGTGRRSCRRASKIRSGSRTWMR